MTIEPGFDGFAYLIHGQSDGVSALPVSHVGAGRHTVISAHGSVDAAILRVGSEPVFVKIRAGTTVTLKPATPRNIRFLGARPEGFERLELRVTGGDIANWLQRPTRELPTLVTKFIGAVVDGDSTATFPWSLSNPGTLTLFGHHRAKAEQRLQDWQLPLASDELEWPR